MLIQKHRPEIDGIRAFAVLAVVFYHADFIQGGYLGVDVFLVLSGYLIGKSILENINQKTFSFIEFFERRARRILPVLISVIAGSTFIAWGSYTPKALKEFAGSAIASLGFSSNFYFWMEDAYFAEASSLKPLLHTWSLSLEEQFYIIFPILIIFLHKYLKKYFLFIFSLIFISSLMAAQINSTNLGDGNFYLLPSRAWEFLAGGILAFLEVKKGERTAFKIFKNIAPIIGLFIMCSSFFMLGKINHPSLITLIPVVGTCLMIWFCRPGEFLTKILSLNGFITIGKLSYGLYLWHFPVFTFMKLENSNPSGMDKIFWITISFVLTALTYFFIETPMRSKKIIPRKKFFIITGLALALVLAPLIWMYETEGGDYRLKNLGLEKRKNSTKCHGTSSMIVAAKPCAKPYPEATKEVLLIGDSHAKELDYYVHMWAHKNESNFWQTSMGGCLQFTGIHRGAPKRGNCTKYGNYPDNLKKWITENPNHKDERTILWLGRLQLHLEGWFDNKEGGKEPDNLDFHPMQSKDHRPVPQVIKENFEFWASQTKNLIIVYPIPEVGVDTTAFFMQQLKLHRYIKDMTPLSTSLAVYRERTKSSFQILDSVKGDNIIRIYPHKIFCSEKTGRCNTRDDKGIFYRDDDHLSPYGARFLMKEIELKSKHQTN